MRGTTSLSESSRLVALEHNNSYCREAATLYCGWNSGFFSNCTVTLWSLLWLVSHDLPVRRIDFSKAFSWYRDKEESESATDLYPSFFKLNHAKIGRARRDLSHRFNLGRLTRPHQHDVYRFIDYSLCQSFVEAFFDLSDAVKSIVTELENRYQLRYEKLVGACYRGTDKGKEVTIADPKRYLEISRKLAEGTHRPTILIQTDEAEVRDLFMGAFGRRCVFFDEMPTSGGGVVVHKLSTKTLGGNRVRWAQTLLAVTHILSRCRQIVNHTGNMALWICLLRGNAEGVVQFGADGRLIETFPQAVAAQCALKGRRLSDALATQVALIRGLRRDRSS